MTDDGDETPSQATPTHLLIIDNLEALRGDVPAPVLPQDLEEASLDEERARKIALAKAASSKSVPPAPGPVAATPSAVVAPREALAPQREVVLPQREVVLSQREVVEPPQAIAETVLSPARPARPGPALPEANLDRSQSEEPVGLQARFAARAQVEEQIPACPLTAVDSYIRLRPLESVFGGATFVAQEWVTIGRAADQDIHVQHDLVGANHAEIHFRDGRFELRPVAGNEVLLNGQLVEQERTLCREDCITLVAPGGPSFLVEMLKPDRAPNKPQGDLVFQLSLFTPIVEPLAVRLDISPLRVLILGLFVIGPLLAAAGLALYLWE